MKAVGLTHYLPISDERSLLDLELEDPTPGPGDLLVRVRAVSVNPVDTKVRAPKPKVEQAPRVLGWDSAGEVVALGADVRGFEVGDRVYYAGDIMRPGSNSELHVVDARIAARMPESLDFAGAAAIPLTGVTAYEALFDRMGVSPAGADEGKSVLIVGGAGGVGSLAIQLAKRVARLRVIATASRPESHEWVLGLGADAVINHQEPLDQGLAKVTPNGEVDFILCLNSTEHHWSAMCRAIAPQGTIASIVEVSGPVDIAPLMRKSARFAWELMFTRPMFKTPDVAAQGEILARLAALIDDGTVKPSGTTVLSPISAATLRKAHAMLEGGHTIGKIVVEGWA
jgi:NADPH2:quinone reductase